MKKDSKKTVYKYKSDSDIQNIYIWCYVGIFCKDWQRVKLIEVTFT